MNLLGDQNNWNSIFHLFSVTNNHRVVDQGGITRKRLTTLFNFLPNAIAGLFGGGGGDAFGTAGHKYLAKGGVVYAAHGFVSRGTDTVPAVLTPGERVLTVNQNQSFEQLPALLGQLLSVLSEPMVTSTSIDIDGNRLADVMLQLNRRNARVAA